MMTNVVIHDQSMSGETIREFCLQVPAENIAISELIRGRIYQEVKERNAKAASQSQNCIQRVSPSQVEVELNGIRSRKSAPIEWQPEFEKALDAFRSNQILIFVDDRQVHSLDEIIQIKPATKIGFLRLTLLMGG